MEAGQKVAIWLYDSGVKLFLGLKGRRPVSRWIVVGTVDVLRETPIGVWVAIDYIEEHPLSEVARSSGSAGS